MKADCENCGETIVLDENQINLVENLKAQGSTFGMLQCPSCGLGFSINPQNLSKLDDQVEKFTWRTPVSGSHGFVSLVDNEDEKPFYGCSETGVVWSTKEVFYRDIESIIKKYPHRSLFYEQRNNGWFPVKDEPADISELINSEDQEEVRSYQR